MLYRIHSPIQLPIKYITVIGIVNVATIDVLIFQNTVHCRSFAGLVSDSLTGKKNSIIVIGIVLFSLKFLIYTM
ncbi:hypothetical protein MnTg03_00642 [bacterium MnTg03]|nr:hypothetical protein MnTg03_00642 [bacterium MnTg03]